VLTLFVVGCTGSNPGSSIAVEKTPGPTSPPQSTTAPTAVATVSLGLPGRIVFERFDPAANMTAVYVADASGMGVELLFGRGAEVPHWSPDHKTVSVFCCDDGMAAHLIDVATGAFRELPPPDPAIEVHCGPWTADGTELACESFGVDDESKNGVYAMRASDGMGLRQLTSNPNGDDLPGDFSTDGKLLVFTRSDADAGTLYVARLGTKAEPKQITPSGAVGQCFCGAFSPDGSQIAYTSALDGGVYLVRPDGSELHKIFQDADGRWAITPAWSPDGRNILVALSRSPDVSNHPPTDLYVIRSDGTEPTLVFPGEVYQSHPDWAP
jgi:Tol biopolymer transport system component